MRLTFRTRVTSEGPQVLFSFKARQVIDLGATHDVHGASGTRLDRCPATAQAVALDALQSR
ncbi:MULTISPECIES: hypothetical protein [unclassified Streptomyces]|uniref:hypothetical protein n=1 Tax=unclassified Streptomyces TaxID=2593676 RepID=UPI0029661E6C|nr:hypothetical protein [Streptomyces sp. SJL17-1]